MLHYLIDKELKEHITTPKMLITSGIILLVMIINGLVFNSQFIQQQQKMNQEIITNSNGLQDNAGSLFKLLFFKQKLVKPPSKLGFIAIAKEEVLPNGIKTNYYKETEPEHYKSQNNYFSRFRSLDWTFLLIYVISFVCLAFSYNAFSGEKVKGTLKLILSNNVSRGTVILGKLIGLHICISMPFFIGILINIIIIQLNPGIALTGGDYLIILIFTLVAFVFIAMNLLLGLFISSLTSKPAHTLNLLLIVWIMLVIIIPSVSWVFSQKIIDVASEEEIAIRLSNEIDKIYESGNYSWSWNGAWAGQQPNDTVKRRAAGIQATDAHRIMLYREYLDQKFKQTSLAIKLSKISPFSLFRFIGERFSDNGYFGFKRFIDQTRIYRATMNSFMTQKDQQDPDSFHLLWSEPWASGTFSSHKPVAFEEIPQFKYQPPELAEIWNRSILDISLLIAWCILLFAGTFIAFIRYDVR
ncbi:ABC transporter permease subunit [bacterium]|nr:ABC transporter permease subunit [bacterium]